MSSFTPGTPQPDLNRKSSHSRPSSAIDYAPVESTKPSKPSTPSASPHQPKEVRYTCFIRLPFKRDGFEDPPAVEWDSIKDKALWKLISKASNSKDLDWEEIAHRFDVSLPFLLQQAAWLYDRHFEGMKAQMRKLGSPTGDPMSPGLPSESPTKSSVGAGGVAMQRTGSRDSKLPSKPSIISYQRDGQAPQPGDGLLSPVSPKSTLPLLSRTPSAATVTQSKTNSTTTSKPMLYQQALRRSSGSGQKSAVTVAALGIPQGSLYKDVIDREDSSDSDADVEAGRSTLAKSRFPHRSSLKKKSRPKLAMLSPEVDDERVEDEDDAGGFLPFAANSAQPPKDDPSATLREPQGKQTTVPASSRPAQKTHRQRSEPHINTESSASSANSAMQPRDSSSGAEVASGTDGGEITQRPGPLSPRHRAQLANMSPRLRREGSEGSPSMGSSFSDLDDASVTQSALEDALLSNMRQGNFSNLASRASSLRDALSRR